MSDTNRIKYLDFAKGIAILSILLGHIIEGYCWQVGHSYHVFLFFIVSGYFISRKTSLGSFVLKKARSLLFPIVFSQIVIFGILLVSFFFLHGKEGKDLFLKNYIDIRLGANGSAPDMQLGILWFLVALFCAAVIVRSILLIRNEIAGTVCAILCFLTGRLISGHCHPLLSEVVAGLHAVPYLYLGYLFKTHNDSVRRFYIKYRNLLTVVIALLASVYLLVPSIHKVDFILCDFRGVEDYLGPLVTVAFVLILSRFATRKENIVASFVSTIGRSSLFILLVHYCEMTFFQWINVEELYNVPDALLAPIRIAFILTLGYALSKLGFLRRAFGLNLAHEAPSQKPAHEDLDPGTTYETLDPKSSPKALDLKPAAKSEKL